VNVSLLTALALVIGWIVLLFVVQVPSGWIHLCYIGAVLLFARRILAGAPRFLS
jgi:hypothetical protein